MDDSLEESSARSSGSLMILQLALLGGRRAVLRCDLVSS